MGSGANVKKADGRLQHHRHSLGESNFHLQFTPNFRADVFIPQKIRDFCKQLFYQKAAQLGVIILAVNFGPDHCHLFVGNCKNYSVPQLVQHFKGYSSRYLRQTFWGEISQKIWGPRFWSEGYFFESVGRVTSESVKFYIERQQGKHWVHEDFELKTAPQAQSQSRLAEFL